eukprot:CAMPEP_0196733282 /NCGR_PEP_ID=MMETSP1091-20130531/12411_1 /TAXON_ID=302021 /ORGANISM="Rhodomonas sp., Strain CCMP768" /LENGTH=470 /DNA_ID=CAMNT_0042076647 /DNA_START=41 /DNA_END=1453 /DNA_ORIENTATION=-
MTASVNDAETADLWAKVHKGPKEWLCQGSTLIGKVGVIQRKASDRMITCVCSAFAPTEPAPRWRLIDRLGKVHDVSAEEAWAATRTATQSAQPVDITIKSVLEAAVQRRQAKAQLKAGQLAGAAPSPSRKPAILRQSFRPLNPAGFPPQPSPSLEGLKKKVARGVLSFTTKIDNTFVGNDAVAGPFSIIKVVGMREINGSMGISRADSLQFFPSTVQHFNAHPTVRLSWEVWTETGEHRTMSVIACNRKNWMNSDRSKPFVCTGIQVQGLGQYCRERGLGLGDTLLFSRSDAGRLFISNRQGADPTALQTLTRNHKGLQVTEAALSLGAHPPPTAMPVSAIEIRDDPTGLPIIGIPPPATEISAQSIGGPPPAVPVSWASQPEHPGPHEVQPPHVGQVGGSSQCATNAEVREGGRVKKRPKVDGLSESNRSSEPRGSGGGERFGAGGQTVCASAGSDRFCVGDPNFVANR